VLSQGSSPTPPCSPSSRYPLIILEEHKWGRHKWGRHFFRSTESEGPLKEVFIKQVWAGWAKNQNSAVPICAVPICVLRNVLDGNVPDRIAKLPTRRGEIPTWNETVSNVGESLQHGAWVVEADFLGKQSKPVGPVAKITAALWNETLKFALTF